MKSFTAHICLFTWQEKCSGSRDEVASHVCGPLPSILSPIIPPLSHVYPSPFPLSDHNPQLTALGLLCH